MPLLSTPPASSKLIPIASLAVLHRDLLAMLAAGESLS